MFENVKSISPCNYVLNLEVVNDSGSFILYGTGRCWFLISFSLVALSFVSWFYATCSFMNLFGSSYRQPGSTLFLAVVCCLFGCAATNNVASWDLAACNKAKKDYGPKGCFGCKDPTMGFKGFQTFDPKPIFHEDQPPERWLQVVIGTVPRAGGLPYLVRTLRAIRHQLPRADTKDPFGNGEVHVKIVNFRPRTHQVFERVKIEFEEHHKSKNTFDFEEMEPNRCDPEKPRGWKYVPSLSPELHPRQQTRDVISLLLRSNYDKCENMLIMEDDFELCPLGLHMIKMAIARADQRGWSTIRVGVGMSGIIIKCSEIPPFISYLMNNQNMMPVDLLYTEYFAGIHRSGKARFGSNRMSMRPFRVLQYNLMDHLGGISTFKGRARRKVVGCGGKLVVNSYMKIESFQAKCAIAGMSPCEGGAATFGAHTQYGFHRANRRALPGNIELVVGELGQSCTEVCQKVLKSKCSNSEWAALDDCNRLTSFFDCPGGCHGPEKTLPDASSNTSPSLFKEEGICQHSSSAQGKNENRCNTKDEHAQRLCPCDLFKK